MADRSEDKSAKRILASKYLDSNAKLLLALLVSLRSDILGKIKMDNLLVTLPGRVKGSLIASSQDAKRRAYHLR
jgi:hypothetical protein